MKTGITPQDASAPYRRHLLLLLAAAPLLGADAARAAFRGRRRTDRTETTAGEIVWYAPPRPTLRNGTVPRPLLILLLPPETNTEQALPLGYWRKMADENSLLLAVPRRTDRESLPRVLKALSLRSEPFDPARVYLATVGPDAARTALVLTASGTSPIRIAAIAQFAGMTAPSTIPRLGFEGKPTPETLQKAGQFLLSHAAQTRLAVRVTHLRSDRGSIVVALFRGGAGFPDKDDKAFATATIAPGANNTAEIVFPALPPGEYAISLFHDENNDRKFNTSFGFPSEGYGVSNNPKPRFGSPRWSDAKFAVIGENEIQTIVVQMRYLRSL